MGIYEDTRDRDSVRMIRLFFNNPAENKVIGFSYIKEGIRHVNAYGRMKWFRE